MVIEFLLNALSVCFELLIYYYFFHFFFGRSKYSKKTMWVAYLLVGIASLILSNTALSIIEKRISYFLIILSLSIFYNGSFFLKCFLSFLFQAISIMVERSYNTLLIPLRIYLESYAPFGKYIEYFIGIVLSNLTIIFVLRFLRSCKKYFFIRKQSKIPKKYCILFLFPILTFFIIDQFYSLIMKSGEFSFYAVLPIFILTMINIAFFILFDYIILFDENKKKLDIMQKQIAQEQQYHQILLNKHQQFQGMRHDMQKHFNTLAGLIKNGHYKEAERFAENQSGKLAATSTIETGVPLLDTILTIKEEEAKRFHCTFYSYTSDIIEIPQVDIDDLASLLSNILDNALDAIQKIPLIEQRKIWVQIIQENKYLKICIRNTVMENIPIQNNTLFTTKQNKELHGFGLSNLKRITEKYNGSYYLTCKNKIFSTTILLPF